MTYFWSIISLETPVWCFHYWDFLTNFWRNNWQSIIDVVERLSFMHQIAKLVPNCSLLSQPNDLNFPITINWFVLQILRINIYYLINSKYNRQVNWGVYFSDTYASSIKGDAEMSRYQEIVFGLHNFNAAKKLLLTKAIILFMTFE